MVPTSGLPHKYDPINTSKETRQSWLSRLCCCVTGDYEPKNLRHPRMSSVDCARRSSIDSFTKTVLGSALPSVGIPVGSRSVSPRSSKWGAAFDDSELSDQKTSLISKEQLNPGKLSGLIQLINQPNVNNPAIKVLRQVNSQLCVNVAYFNHQGVEKRQAFLISLEELKQIDNNKSTLIANLKTHFEGQFSPQNPILKA